MAADQVLKRFSRQIRKEDAAKAAYVFSVGLYILAEVSQLVGSATREAAPDGHRG